MIVTLKDLDAFIRSRLKDIIFSACCKEYRTLPLSTEKNKLRVILNDVLRGKLESEIFNYFYTVKEIRDIKIQMTQDDYIAVYFSM